MKKLLSFLLLFLVLALSVKTTTAQTSTYFLNKDMTASELADKLGIDLELLREANLTIIKGPSTKLKSGTVLYLPDIEYEYYQQDYLLIIGYTHAWNEGLNSSMFYGQVEYLPILELDLDWNLGAFVMVKGGGLQLTNGAYNEPSVGWQAGAKTRIKSPGIYYNFFLGYGQNNLSAQLATGFQQKLFSHYLLGGAEFHAFSNRFLDQSPWFNDARIYTEVRFPLKKDELFLSDKPVNLELLADQIRLGGDLTVFDWSLSDEILLPLGLAASASLYDLPDKKSFYTAGAYICPTWNKRPIGRFSFDYQSGVSNINFKRFVVSVVFDFGTFLDRNEAKFNIQ